MIIGIDVGYYAEALEQEESSGHLYLFFPLFGRAGALAECN